MHQVHIPIDVCAGEAIVVRTRPAFFAAVDRQEAYFAQTWTQGATQRRGGEVANLQVPSCQRPKGNLSPAEKKCKEYYDLQRKEAKANNGCAYQTALGARGEDAWALQGDHIDPTKTMQLGNYKQWLSSASPP